MARSKHKPWDQPHQEESGEELWIVSYADMVTLLFGFFVILYSFSTRDEKKFDQMGEQIASAFKAPKDLSQNVELAEDLSEEMRELRAFRLLVGMLSLNGSQHDVVERIESAYRDKKDEKATTDLLNERLGKETKALMRTPLGGEQAAEHFVELVLPDSSLFEPGSAALSESALKKLKELGSQLQATEDTAVIEVVGHTDGRQPGRNAAYTNNFALSSARAGAVAQALILGGVSKKSLLVRGMADLEPLLPEHDAQGHALLGNSAKNRRVHIILRKRPHEQPGK